MCKYFSLFYTLLLYYDEITVTVLHEILMVSINITRGIHTTPGRIEYNVTVHRKISEKRSRRLKMKTITINYKLKVRLRTKRVLNLSPKYYILDTFYTYRVWGEAQCVLLFIYLL